MLNDKDYHDAIRREGYPDAVKLETLKYGIKIATLCDGNIIIIYPCDGERLAVDGWFEKYKND